MAKNRQNLPGKVLVTGGAGFIGSAVVRQLLARGYSVTVLDNFAVGRIENVPSNIEIIRADVCEFDFAGLFDARRYQHVVHLAAHVSIRDSAEQVASHVKTNTLGTARIASAVAASEVDSLIFTSSMAVYSDSKQPLSESSCTRVPKSPYGVSKMAAEMFIRTVLADQPKKNVRILRLFNTFGQGQAESKYVGVVTRFLGQLSRGENISVYGTGQQQRDFVWVEDVAMAILGCVERPIHGFEVLNIGSGQGTAIDTIADRCLAYFHQQPTVKEYAPAIGIEPNDSVADISRAKQKIGFCPTKDIETYLREIAPDALP